MAEMIIGSNDDGRKALTQAAKSAGISLSALGISQGIAQGALTGWVNDRPSNKTRDPQIQLGTFIRALDGVGYEVVVRPKATGSRRERKLRAIKQRSNGDGGAAA